MLKVVATGMLSLLVLGVSFGSLVPRALAVDPDNIISYQGRLLNSEGVPVSVGSANMQFALWDALVAGSCLWNNNSTTCAAAANMSVSLTDGLFSVNLGDTGDGFAAIDDTVFADNAGVYLEVIVEGETLTPRKRVVAAPYALNAQTIDGIDGADLCQTSGTNCPGGVGAWETGAFATYEDDDDVVIGTSGNETISNAGFTLDGDNLFVTGDIGVEGKYYTDGGITTSGQLLFDGVPIDITTTAGESLLIAPAGSGNILLNADANSNVRVVATGAPTTNLFSVTNTGFGATSSVNGIDVTYVAAAGGSGETNAGVDITMTASGDASDTLRGLSIAAIPGSSSSEVAISIGDGWDSELLFLGTTPVIAMANTGTLTFTDAVGNSMMTIADGGTTGNVTVTGNASINGNTTIGDSASDTITFNATIATGSIFSVEGATNDAFETSFNVVDPTADRTITFQNATGTVAFTSDIPAGSGLWESGAFATYEDDDDVVVGTSGGETIANAGFSLSGNDFFAASDAGIEGNIYTDGSLIVGSTTTYSDGSITDTDSNADDLFDFSLAAGADAFRISTGNLRVGNGVANVALNGEDAYIEGTLEVDSDVRFDGDLAVNGGDITSTGTLNVNSATTNALTLDSGTTGTVNIATSNNAKTLNLATGTAANTVNIATDATAGDTIAIGNTNASTTLALTGGDDWNMAGTGVLSMTASAAQTTAIVVTDTDYTNALSIGDNNITGTTFSLIGTTAVIDFTNFDVASTGAITVAAGQGLDTNAAGALALGNTNATSVSLCNSAACDTVTIGTNADADTITIGDSTDSTSLNSANWSMATSGNLTTAGDIAVNGGDVTTTATTWNFAVGNTGTINWTDGSNNLMALSDGGTVGNLNVSGDITATGDNIDSAGAPLVLNATATDEVRVGTGTPGIATGAGDLYVTSDLEVDGTMDVASTITAGDFSCTDCLDFTEFADALSLDASTSIAMSGAQTLTFTNGSTGAIVFNLTSTGDFNVQDSGTTVFSVQDGGYVKIGSGSGTNTTEGLVIDAADVSGVTTEQRMFGALTQVIDLASGTTIADQRTMQFLAPTINGIAGGPTETITNASTVYIGGAPGGSDITFTNGPYALFVDLGTTRLDGDAIVGGGTSFTETLSNAGFVMGGDDLFVAGLAGVEGNIYTDGSLVVGATTTYSNGSITDTDSNADDLFDFSLAAGADAFRISTGNLRVGNGTSDVALNGEDAYIEGTLEVDSNVRFDGDLAVNGGDITSTGALNISPGGTLTIGDGGDAVIIDSNGTVTLNDTVLAFQAAGTITTSGAGNDLNFSPADELDVNLTTGSDLMEVFIGNFKVGNGTPDVTLNGEDAYVEGTLEVDSAARFDAAITQNFTGTTTDAFTITANSLSSGSALVLTKTSASGSMTDDMQKIIQTQTYIGGESNSASLLDLARSITNTAGAGSLTTTADILNITNDVTVSAGSVADLSSLLSLSQNYTSAGGSVIDLINAGTGRSLTIDTDQTTTDVILVTADSLSTGSVLQADTSGTFSGNLIQLGATGAATGDFIEITSTSATATARAINIDLDNGNNDNDVFVLTTDETTNSGTAADTVKARITASGEFLSDVGFTAGGASTRYRDGSITSTTNPFTLSAPTSFTFNDDASNTLMTLTDAGTTGNLTVTGDLAVNGADITSTSALTIDAGGSITLGNNDSLLTSGTNTFTEGNGETFTINKTLTTDTNEHSASFTLTNSAPTNVAVKSILNLTNADDGGATGVTSDGLLITNLDSNEAITNGIRVRSTAAGGITNGLTILASAGSIATGINLSDAGIVTGIDLDANDIVGTTADINFTNFDVVGSTGNITTAGDLAVNGGDITATTSLALTTSGGGTDITLDPVDDLIITPDDINITMVTGSQFIENTTTAGLFHILNITADPNSGGDARGIQENFVVSDDANANQNFVGFDLRFQNNSGDAGDTTTAMQIVNEASTGAVTDAMLKIDNDDSTSIPIGLTFEGLIDDDIQLQNGETIDNSVNGEVLIENNGVADLALFSTTSLVLNLDDTGTYTERLCHSNSGSAAGNQEIADCRGSPGDLAEYYGSDGGLTPGDLVVATDGGGAFTTADGISTSKAFVTKSTTSYQSGVIGAISTRPSEVYGNTIFDPSENPVQVALVGRIPLHTSTENGAIAAGDRLVASSTPGYAMKATQPGWTVGVALEDLASGSGSIIVFIEPSWYAGNILMTDGTTPLIDSNIAISSIGAADATTTGYDSYGLALRGSGWNGSTAEDVSMSLVNAVTDASDYRLSLRNTLDTEVAYLTNDGTFSVSGDMIVGGKLYPSDRGVAQTSKYIYYDGDTGIGGDFMRTNASGWATGSYDFAEMFPASGVLESGDVVVFDTAQEHVARSTSAYDLKIAGIVSTRPGFLAGENKDGDYPIALAGRVPTKVTNQNGNIQVGDPLTSSSKIGYAMKATQPGPIVGYALEPYTGGADDRIIAFVNVSYWSGGTTTALPGTNNTASQTTVKNSNLTSLSMDGDIHLNAHDILGVRRLAGLSEVWSIEEDGTIKTQAILKTMIKSYQNDLVETTAVTSREATVTLVGTAEIDDGIATIEFQDIDPSFRGIISNIAPIRVVVTPNGPVSLYVEDKSNDGFTVRQIGGSDNGISFDWMVSAYRKDFEPEEYLHPDEAVDSPIVEEPVVEPPTDAPTEEIVPPAEDTVTDTSTEPEAPTDPASTESPSPDSTNPSSPDVGGLSAEEPSGA